MSTATNPPREEDKLSQAYILFFKLFMAKFVRASRIWWGSYTKIEDKGKGRSLADWVSDDPVKAIDQLTQGKFRRFDRLVSSKFEEALVMWAVEKLGKDFEKHMSPALEDFFTTVFLDMGWPRPFLTAINRAALYIPPQLRKRTDFPLESLYELKKEYETLLTTVKNIKNKTRRNPSAQKLALIENLPGTNGDKATAYQGMKPSQIVMAHMARKYKMPISGEGFKQYLTKRIPQDLIERELRRRSISKTA